MVLLTSSTVSVILSTGVISIFTILLFLSGYTLQQQSVRNIQHALRPPAPPEPKIGHGSGESSFQGTKRSLLSDLVSDDNPDDSGHTQSPTGGNYAYLQLLSHPDPSNICSAILFFKQLASNGTAVQDRLFMYPQEWDMMAATNQLSEPVSTALSLLRDASLKYGIWLLPIDMTAATSAGYAPTDTKLLRLGQIQFMQYDSVLYVQNPGMLLDTGKLDDVLLSRPLPLRHDPSRTESFNNEAWIPMPLRADRDATLPPVYLITVNNVGNGHVEARGHVPNVALPGFGRLVTGPEGARSSPQDDEDDDADPQPGYVVFEHDDDGHVKWAKNPLFGAWRAQQYQVCEGLDFDDVHDDDL
ncbi:uncharacterized protein KD926_008775 [Aspergillus affinis]|uniref:uncharacterized protein n=1 Tax=Aspergillus affinis TaxID=1070780 RepID=UPI0022FEBD5A|nr:uncharacterized protein KD926_008775 [Aspergillus affinis]KAI9045349.1 hypothetical protein KD926_008775 [Aspergillus affinis]